MGKEAKSADLFTLIDKKFLQELQDNFAKVTGLASVTLDQDGFITEPSNFCDFCRSMKANEKSNEACQKCDLERRNIGFQTKKPFVYTCHAGLTIFVVPIVVNNETIAIMVGGQTIINKPDESFYKKLAKDFEMDETEYLKNVKKIKVSTNEKIEAAANLLSQIANTISNMAHQNYMLQKKNENEKLYKDIVKTIRSTLDIKEVKKRIVNTLGKALSADRCFLMEYDDSIKKFLIIEDEYVSSHKIEEYKGADVNIDVPNFMNELKDGKYLMIKNKKIYLNGEHQEFAEERLAIKKYGVNSAYAVPLFSNNIFIGILGVHYLSDKHIVNEKELELLLMIADQIALSIYQAKLYNETQIYAEREKLLREIIEILRSSLDLKEVKKNITKTIGKAFNADRCYFRSYDKRKGQFSAVDVEYLGSDKIASLIDVEPNQETLKFFSDEVKKQNRGFYPIIVDKEFAKGSPLEQYFKQVNIAADYAIPIIDRYDELTWLVLHYTDKNPNLAEEDKKLLGSIAYQIASTFEQIKLYEKEKTTAEREALLRKVSFTIRESLNLEETFNVICSEINKITGANRVTITESVNTEKNHIIRGEFKTDINVKGAIEKLNQDRIKVFKYLTSYVFNKNKPLVINNLAEADLPDFAKEFYTDLKVKSLAVFPIKKFNDEWGVLTISHNDKYKNWDKSNVDFVEAIIEQVYIAIKQAKLYDETLLRAKRENIIRNITDKIRGSLNMEDTLTFICEETAKFLNVQRSSIIVFPEKNNYMSFQLKKEYKEDESIKGYQKISDINKVAEYWGKMLLKHKVYGIDNILESDAPEFFKNSYSAMGVKAVIGATIGNEKEVWGNLLLSEYNKDRHWDNDEKDFLNTISQQIYIAINQAELYSNMLQQNEREKAILANLPFLVWLKDQESRFLAVNELFAEMCGTNADNLIGKNDYDFWSKELADDYVKEDREVMQKKKTKSVEELIQGPNGLRWHETYKTPFYNDKGEVVGTTGFSRDITEKKEAQEKIIRAAQRETLLRKITEKIRSSLNIEDTLTFICEEIAKLFKVQRTAIAYSTGEEEKNRFPLRKEYKDSPNLPVLMGKEVYDKIVVFWTKLALDLKDIILFDNIETSDAPDFFKEAYNEIGVKSAIGIPIKKGNDIFGNLILYAYNDLRHWTDDEKYLLESIAGQIYIAISQAELYENEKKSAERETLVRNIIETIRSSINIEKTKQTVIDTIGKAFNADRCFIIEYDKESGNYLEIKDEYLSSENIKSLIGADPQREFPMFAKAIKQGNVLLVQDGQIIVDSQDQNFEVEKHSLQKYGLNSGYALPIYYKDEPLGILSVNYVKNKHKITDEEIDLLHTISNQTAIALHQARLYNETQVYAQRETLLRNIIEKIRSSLDVHEIIHTFVFEIGKTTKAQKVFFSYYDESINSFLVPNEYSEYRESPDLLKYTDMDKILDNNFPAFCEYLKTKKSTMLIYDTQKFLKEKGLEHSIDMENIKKYNFSTAIAFPVVSQNKLIGFYGIEFEKATDMPQADVDFLTVLAEQTFIAMNQAELYQKTQNYAEREILIRKIIETVRSTLDIKQMKKQIVTEVGKTFNVERCVIQQFDFDNNKFDIIDEFSEYKSSDTFKSYIGINIEIPQLKFFRDMFAKGEEMLIPEWEQHLENIEGIDEETKNWIKSLEIKSDYVFPIIFNGQFIASLYMTYTTEKKYLSEEDINSMRTLTNQIAIGFYQAQLYETQKLAAEREKMSRNIIEILRSTMDKTIIKRLFVKNIGKFFNADRVLLSEYDSNIKAYLPVDSNAEYSTSPEFKTLVGYDWSKPEISEFIQPLLEKRELNIYDFDEYIKQNHKGQGFIDFFVSYDIKSSYNFPIMYENELLGFFCLDYIGEPKILSNEDIGRIRSICTQAGIALYHANLYTKAKECELSRQSFLSKFSDKIRQPVYEIVDVSNLLSQNEFEHSTEVEYLNKILGSCNYLLELTTEMNGG